jgi:hypothetical protein
MKDVDVTLISWLGTCAVMILFFVVLVIQIGEVKDKIDYADIAGTTVPAVHCQEDEVISWTGPDALGCVYYEEVK